MSILGSSAASDDPYDNPLNMWMEEDDDLLTEPLESLEDLRVGELVKMVRPQGVSFIQILLPKRPPSNPHTIYYRDSQHLRSIQGTNFTNTEGLFVANPIKIRDCVPYDNHGGCTSTGGYYRPREAGWDGDRRFQALGRERRRIEEAKRIGHGRP